MHPDLDPSAADGAGLPDPASLRRRVLLTAVVSLLLFLAVGYVITAVNASSIWLLPSLLLLFLLVVRPLMRPVREASRLRRRLAYQAFVAQRADLDREDR